MRIRKPRLRIGKSGKISLSGGGVSFGGKNARVNLSKSGVSGTLRAGKASYNTRRGCSMPFFVAGILLFLSGVFWATSF